MASIKKSATGWRVQIAIQGVRESKSPFSTKAEAAAWAARRETEIRQGAAAGIQMHRTVDEAFRRYQKEVSPTSLSIGGRWSALPPSGAPKSAAPSSKRCCWST
jgi:hypothetical protein